MTETKKKIIIGAVWAVLLWAVGYWATQWVKLINSQLELNKLKTELATYELKEKELQAQYKQCVELMPQLHEQAEEMRAKQADISKAINELVGLE